MSSVDRVLANEMHTYELHLVEKQKRILQQFEATATESRLGVLEEERLRNPESQSNPNYLREFEENLEREIEAQRKQLMTTLAANRAEKLASYRVELVGQMEAFMAGPTTQPPNPLSTTMASPHSFTTTSNIDSISSSIHQQIQHDRSRAQETEKEVQTTLADRQQWREMEEQHHAFLERERHEKEQHEKRVREAEEQRKARLEAFDAPLPSRPPMACPVHRYEFNQKAQVTRVENTPASSPTAHQQAQPAPSPIPLHMPPPQASPAKDTTTAPTEDSETELRRKWNELQQELHGGYHGPLKTGPRASPSQPSHQWKPAPAASPASNIKHDSHLKHVSASPEKASGASADETTNRTLAKMEHALEMDWSEAWDDLSRVQQQQQRKPPQAQTPAAAAPVRSAFQASPMPIYHAPPRPTPLADKLTKAVVPVQAQAPSHLTSHPPDALTSDPAHLLQHASGLFHETLGELEQKAAYLQQLIQTFKQAEQEMKAKVDQTFSQQQHHQPQPQPSQQRFSTQYEQAGPYPSYSVDPDATAQEDQDAYEEYVPSQQSAQAQRRPTARPTPTAPLAQIRRAASSAAQATRPVSAVKPKVAFAPGVATAAAAQPALQARPRSASAAAGAAKAAVRSAAVYPPRTRPLTSSFRKAPSSALKRPASAQRSGISAPPAALNYPRPRTASAKAALGPGQAASKANGVRAARSRIRAIVDSTRIRPRSVSVLEHSKPSQAFIPAPEAKGGLRQASVQEVLRGAAEIQARRFMPPGMRPKADPKPVREATRDPAEEYDYIESSPAHPREPVSLIRAAKEQREASHRLTMHSSGLPSGSPAQARTQTQQFEEEKYPNDSLDYSTGSAQDLNTTEGLIKQEEKAQARFDGHLEEYLRALALPSSNTERAEALARLASKSAETPTVIYSSPLRTHPSQRPKQKETFLHRADAIIRGSHANNAPQRFAISGNAAQQALQDIVHHHHVTMPQQQQQQRS